jgi:hypothetical protein
MDKRISAYKKTVEGARGQTPDAEKKAKGEEAFFSSEEIHGLPSFVKQSQPLSKSARLARFVAIIGVEAGDRALAALPGAEAVIIKKEAASLRKINSPGRLYGMNTGEISAIYEEFRALLENAGSEAADLAKPLAFLNDFSGEQVNLLLHKESPQVCALVLSRIEPKLAARAIGMMEVGRKKEVMLRLSRLKPVPGDVITTIAESIREKTRAWGKQTDRAPDGMEALISILKNSPLAVSNRIIEDLQEQNPLLGVTLRANLYSLDDVCRASNRVIAEKLQEMDERQIACLIRGQPGDFVDKILSNVSDGRRALIKE